MNKKKTTFKEPSKKNYRFIIDCWTSMKNLIIEEYHYTLSQSPSDISYIETLLSDGFVDIRDDFTLDCIAISLGRILVNSSLRLDWWMAGKSKMVIRYQESPLAFDIFKEIREIEPTHLHTSLNKLYSKIVADVIHFQKEN